MNPIKAIIDVKQDVVVPTTHPPTFITSLDIIGIGVNVAVACGVEVG